ncbi:hypothetical protein CK203_062868 [Vitis vinifera]|uniref:Uncharacterized protein n=1 Tax=Vitis vinifera TaxID=29760 RepID=A0A438FSM3_VITVI|nr:hypothetical protein CK203_062868 [Vitis vinifera]
MCGGDFMSKNPEEAMDFLSYVAEVSRGWDEPNSREKGKFPSQQTQNPKAGMYMLSEDMDMKAKVATMQGGPTTVHLMETPIIQAGETIQIFLGNQGHLHTNHKPNPSTSTNLFSGASHCEPEQDEELLSKKTLVKESNNQEEKSGKKSASKSSIEEEPRIVIKEDMMKKHMPPLFLTLYMERRKSRIHHKFLKFETSKERVTYDKKAFLTEQVVLSFRVSLPVKYKIWDVPPFQSTLEGRMWRSFARLGGKCEFVPYSVYKQLGLGGLKPHHHSLLS